MKDKVLLPEDKGLGEPVRRFEDTFSVWTVIKNKFFPDLKD